MHDKQVHEKALEWEAAGFKFIGNGFENNDDDPTLCPKCDSAYIFWALWEHPTKQRHVETESEYNPLLLNSANTCMDCGHRWIDEDPAPADDK